MFYENELRFLQKTLDKCHIPNAVIHPEMPIADYEHTAMQPFMQEEEEVMGMELMSLNREDDIQKSPAAYPDDNSYPAEYKIHQNTLMHNSALPEFQASY